MKRRPFNYSALAAAASASALPRQIILSNFHTKVQFIQRLRGSKDYVYATSTHSNILKSGLVNDTVTVNHLINSYVRFRRIGDAHRLFDEMREPNVVSWTSLMAGFINVGQPEMATFLFCKMHGSSVRPNDFTLSTAINACSILADLEFGRKVHAYVVVLGFRLNVIVCSSLIDMYGKCNEVDSAQLVFDSMCDRNIVSWSSMVTAYAQNAQGHHALELFRKFTSLMESPNHYMLASVINACASLGRLVSGKVAHGLVIRRGHDSNDVIASALVDMYAKCGCVDYSDRVFRKIRNPSVIPYTSMIVSAAKYGLGALSLELFDEMIRRRVKPNNVTFVGVLHACSHSGLIDEGLELINSMHKIYGVKPELKHLTCAVDMLGRVGRLDEAYHLAKSIEVEPEGGALLWGTILSTSRTHGRLDIACEASKRLIDSKQQVALAYVTLSNTFALAGDWESVDGLRSEMRRTRIYKQPGCSWIEINDSIYVFHAGDVSSCAEGSDVLKLLGELEDKMKERGYVGGSTGLVFVDVEKEAKENIVSLHSERLALAFGLIKMPKGVTIRVMKNLRMCKDCHEALKLISDITQREFIVRDVNRFHHFKSGCCTCRDFW